MKKKNKARLTLAVVNGKFKGDKWYFNSIIELDKFIYKTRHLHKAGELVRPGTMKIYKNRKEVGAR